MGYGSHRAEENKKKATPPNRHSTAIIQKCKILTIARPGTPPFIRGLQGHGYRGPAHYAVHWYAHINSNCTFKGNVAVYKVLNLEMLLY